MTDPGTRRRNLVVVVGLVGLVAGMTGLSFAAVPLYDMFCRVTGFGGTTQVAESPAERVLQRRIRIRFNADVNQQLPWDFRPEVREVALNVGESALVSYRAHNRSDQPVVGHAVYNVTPQKAGYYFNKVQCFCFEEQRLEPGQTVDMPVYFFVDPAIADDPNLNDVNTITLSYTFFRSSTGSTTGSTADGQPPQVSENHQAPVAANAN